MAGSKRRCTWYRGEPTSSPPRPPAPTAGAAAWVFPWPGWVLAFFAFRAFDILKPGPIGRADRMETPLGVMLDDVFAGIGAAVLVALGAYIAHGVMGV